MSLKNRRVLLVLVLAICSLISYSQTLYWVGGSGNFNDPWHWSLQSGGSPANVVPGSQNTVVFDDKSGTGAYEVNLAGITSIKSFSSTGLNNVTNFSAAKGSTLNVGGDFYLSQLTKFETEATIVFSNTGANSYIETGLNKLKGDIYFKGGSFRPKAAQVDDFHTIYFQSGSFRLDNAFIVAGSIINENPAVVFNISDSYFSASHQLTIKSDNNFTVNNLKLAANWSNNQLINVPTSFQSKKISNLNLTNAICPVTISTSPACTGSCSGILAITFPTSCVNSPYDINVFSTTGSCTPVSNTLTTTGLTVTPGTTFTIGGACPCLASNYFVQISDGLNQITPGQFINFIANPIFLTTTTVAPSCNSSCNGSLTGNLIGTSPYSVTVLPATVTPNSFTTAAGFSLTGLCATTYTFNIFDASGCANSVTKNLNGPAAITATTTPKNLVCNSTTSGNIGAFSVTPGGGTPNYTVAFSSGGTFSTTTGGTVSATSLAPGPISATITDSHGCTTTTSATITQPTSITIVPTQTNLTCPGVCSGVASVAVSGGGGAYTYTWNPAGGNAAGASSLCAGAYTVSLTDNLGCVRGQTFTVTQPTSITLVPSVTNLSCNAVCSGAASVAASGPTTAISFTWLSTGPSVVSLSNSITAQCAGIYTIIAKDAVSPATCVATQTINITQPPAFTVAAVTQSISCALTPCTGAATINASGSNGAPYTYTWTPGGQTTSVVTSMCAGNYTVSVRDPSNCVASATVSIIQPPTFTAGITTTSVNCNGSCTGIINSSPTGGTAPYTFTLITPTGTLTTSPPYNTLCAGNYTLLIKDSSPATCAQVFTATIQQAPALVPSISTTSITCFNQCNGSLGGSAVGGTPTYSFTWNTPTGTVSGGSLSGRCAGAYTLTVRDANNCTVSATSTLTQPTDVTVSIVSTSVTCFSACNGVLSGNVSGGTPGYTLSWSNGFTGNPDINLCTGNYTLTVTDQNGCVKTATSTVGTPSAITLAQTTSATACSGSCNGSATITATGGTPPFLYSYNSATPAVTNTTGIITGLCAGNYIASVTDANSCPQSIAFSISSPPLLSAAITGTQNSCTACTGAATVLASNGSPGYTYAWTNSLSATVGTNAAASSLCAGNYTVTVTDSHLCTATTTVGIQQTVISAAVLGGSGILCFGACTGSAVVSPSGGTPPYNYTWTPSAQTTQTATGLCAGNYTVTVKESAGSGCTSTATINITTPSSITVSGTSSNLTCFNVCNGAITSTVSGGTGTMNYSWSPGGASTSSVSSLCNGTYTLHVTDANGCTTTPQTFTVTQPTSITATFVKTLPTGCSLNNGSICATPSGGSGSGYTYTWSPVTGSTSCISSLSAGVYSVIVADGAGCTTSLATILNSPSGPTISTSQQSVACFNAATGGCTVTALGTAPFNYTWTPAAAGNVSVAAGVASGTYIVSVQDGNNCITNQSVVIQQPSSLTVNSNLSNSKCSGGSPTGSITITPSGATPAYSFSWTGPSFNATTQNVTGLGPGTYSLVVTDANLCPTQFTYSITAPPAITLNVTSTKSVICAGFTNGSITAAASGGTLGFTYSWTPLAPFTGSTTPTVLNLGPGVYSVVATDGNNCPSAPATWTLTASTLSASVLQQSATCASSCNAAATLNVSGGSPTYTFSWSFGTSTTSVLSGLCVGNYTGSVVDGDGCVSQKGFTVSPASSISLTSSGTNPKCNAACNGSILVTPTGAVGAVTYSWMPMGSGANPTNLCSGTYTVIATDGNTCSASNVITLTDPPALISNVTSTNPLCNANCNGIAVAHPTNAVGAVSYTWLPAGPNSPTVSSLCAGTYTCLVQDANGCSDTQTLVLTTPAALNINSSIGPATCGSSNGSITLIPSGGTPGYTYSWSPNVSSTLSANSLSAQVYTVVVTDAANCSNTITIPLSNSNGPTAIVSSTNVLCFGQSNGAASVGSITGGTPPYQPVVWISPPPNNTVNAISGLAAGNYTAQLQDANGCITFTGATITQPSSISINPNLGLPTCNGICNGSINVSASGGVPTYNYSWTPAAANTSVLTGLCAGDYTLMISHNSGSCTQTQTFNIPGQVNLTFTDNVIPNNCFGNCNGVATVSVIPTLGIPSPFAFSWSNGQTGTGPFSSSVNNLCNGLYSVTATGLNGCFNVYTVNITSPTQLTLATSVMQPSCNQCNGGATVTPGGGAGSTYSINWAFGPSTTTVSNLCAGIYPVTISDNNGCTQSATVTVNNSSSIAGPTITTQDIPCGATCTGAATIVATSTNAPVTYNWISPAISGTTASNLCPGDYFVQMQDAQGCIKNASLTINAATNITVSAFVTPPACGLTNGSIHLVTAGGTPSYNFNWAPSAPNSGTVNNVGPGSYTITVTDSSPGGCATTSVININNLNAPVVAFSSTNINCFNACTGAANANVTGTATPFTYNWSVGGNTSSLSSLCKGVITLSVTDANSCVAVKSLTITDNAQLQAGVPNVTQPTCGQCNGAVTVGALGGVGPYTYSWTSGFSGASQSSLCAGLYQVLITDNLGCQQTQNVIINNSNGITGETFSVQNVVCNGNCNGAVTVTPIGGTAPISFAWINPALASTANSVNGLCPGTYFVKMTDAQGCARTASADVTAATSLSVTPNVLQPGCGVSNGVISLVVSGGTLPYTFSWSPVSASGSSLTGLSPGVYTVVVTDQNGAGCSLPQIINLNNLNGPSLTFTQNNIACFGQCNGSVQVTATGTAATTFTWSTGSNAAGSGTSCAGVITLTASANGCESIRTFTITQNPELEFNFDFKPISCLNNCDGRISIQAVGGMLAYTFGGTTPPNSSNVFSLCAGVYTMSVTDANGCVADSAINLKSPAPITATLNALNSSCSSVADGSAGVIAAGGTPGYSYLWQGPSSFTSTGKNLINIFSGTYTLSITDTLGCKKDSVLSIVTTVTIDANAGIDTLVCPGSSVAISGLNSLGVTKYEWYQLPNSTSTVANTASFSIANASDSYTYMLVTISNSPGCFDRDTIVVSSYSVPYIEAGPSYTIPLFSTVTIGGNPTSAGVSTVTWTPAFGLTDANLENPVCNATLSTNYTVSISYGKGCIVSDTMFLNIYPEIKVNSGFSPNGDGKNDRWIIDYLEQFPNNTVEIFNRWGDRLFFSTGYTVPWDGKFNGKDLPVGTYYYVIHLNHPAYPKPYTGPVTIFR